MNIYDFDKTLCRGDSTAAFLRYSLRKHPSLLRFLPGVGWAAFRHYLLKATDKTTMKEQFYRIFTGYDAPALLEEFWDKHRHKIFHWYPGQQEETDILISASPEFLLEPICTRLGIKTLMASRVDPKTGKYNGLNCWGDEKVRRLEEQTGITHCDKFFSDSYSDTPLAKIADEAFLIKKGKICPWEKKTARRIPAGLFLILLSVPRRPRHWRLPHSENPPRGT